MQEVTFEKQRASNRLCWSLPVLLDCNKTIYTGSTENLSAAGARLKAPVAIPPGAQLALTNLQTGHRARFRVVWGSAERESDESFRLGVAMMHPSDVFWGFQWSSGARPLGGMKRGESLSTQTLSWRNR